MITIRMNQLYSGRTTTSNVPGTYGVTAELGNDGSVVNYHFRGRNWTQKKAYRWIKNRNLNNVEYREHDNGKVFFNQLRMNGNIVLGEIDARKILGDKYEKLAALESSYGGDEPFLVEIIPMNFNGKETVVGNRLRFHRENVNGMIKKFSGLPIHLGHKDFFSGEKVRIGNTVASRIGEDGNPHAYAYFNPHGAGREFRDSMRVAAAQNLLHTFSFSVVGKPIDVEIIEDRNESNDVDVSLAKDGAYAIVHKFEPKFVDAVNEPALEGSTSIAIINSKNENIDIGDVIKKNRSESMDTEITLSQALRVLGSEDNLILSDLLKVESLKDAFDEYANAKIEKRIEELKKDEDFKLSLVSTIDRDKLLESDIVKNVVKLHSEEIQNCRDKVADLAVAHKIELTGPHKYLVLNAINEPMSEQALLDLIRQTAAVTDLSDVPDFFLNKEVIKKDSEEVVGIKFADIEDPDKVKTISL